ncbi:hypothetical protein ES703_65601 [subsurface metagenome]
MIDYIWYQKLPKRFRPDNVDPNRMHSLDDLRKSWSLTDEVFSEILIQSDWATKKLQTQLYEDAKKENPGLSDKQIFKEIIMSRTSSCIPFGLDISEKEVDSALNSIRNKDELIEFIMSQEKAIEPPDQDQMRSKMNTQISKIMELQEESQKLKPILLLVLRIFSRLYQHILN